MNFGNSELLKIILKYKFTNEHSFKFEYTTKDLKMILLNFINYLMNMKLIVY